MLENIFFHKDSWALFWNTVKILGNSLILSGLAFKDQIDQCLVQNNICSPTKTKPFQILKLEAPWIMRLSALASDNRNYMPCPGWTPEIFPFMLSTWLFPWHALSNTQLKTQVGPSTVLWSYLFLYSVLLLTAIPCKLYLLWPPWTSSSVSSNQGDCQALPAFSMP